MCLGPSGLHVELDEEIVARPPASKALAVDVHGEAEGAHGQSGTAEGEHDLLGALGGNPVICKVGETVEHEVLQHEGVVSQSELRR